jgi:hypothetical protein
MSQVENLIHKPRQSLLYALSTTMNITRPRRKSPTCRARVEALKKVFEALARVRDPCETHRIHRYRQMQTTPVAGSTGSPASKVMTRAKFDQNSAKPLMPIGV